MRSTIFACLTLTTFLTQKIPYVSERTGMSNLVNQQKERLQRRVALRHHCHHVSLTTSRTRQSRLRNLSVCSISVSIRQELQPRHRQNKKQRGGTRTLTLGKTISQKNSLVCIVNEQEYRVLQRAENFEDEARKKRQASWLDFAGKENSTVQAQEGLLQAQSYSVRRKGTWNSAPLHVCTAMNKWCLKIVTPQKFYPQRLILSKPSPYLLQFPGFLLPTLSYTRNPAVSWPS